MEILVFALFLYLGLSPDAISHALTRGGAGAARNAVRHAAATKRAATSALAQGRAGSTKGRAGDSSARVGRSEESQPAAATQAPTGSAWDAAVTGWRTGVADARQRRAEGRDAWSKARRAAKPAAVWAATQAGTAWGWASGKTAGASGWTLYRSPVMAGAAAGGTAALADMLTTKSTSSTPPTTHTPTYATDGEINAGHVTLNSTDSPAETAPANQTTLTSSSTPALDAPAPTSPVVHHDVSPDPDAPTPLVWPGNGGYLAVTSTADAAQSLTDTITTHIHQEKTMSDLATTNTGMAYAGGDDLASLDAIESEAQAMRASMLRLVEAQAYMAQWGAGLHDRWSASQWGTAALDAGVAAAADAVSSIPNYAEDAIAGIDQVLAGVEQARGLAEQATAQQAYGDTRSFTQQ